MSSDLELATTSNVAVPLLNNYKHGLLRRRFLQTLLGGAKVRRVPYYVHLIQALLWVLPLVLSVPFLVVDGLGLWNQYLLAMVYGCAVGVLVLVEGVVVASLRRRWRRGHDTAGVGVRGTTEENDEDDESDEVIIMSCIGPETINFVFGPKRLLSVVVHPLVSGAFCFAGSFVLLPSVMQESMPIGGVVVVSVFGWFAMCVAHYSLAVRAPPETAVYRHVDPLELKFLHRPFHLLLAGIVFITLR